MPASGGSGFIGKKTRTSVVAIVAAAAAAATYPYDVCYSRTLLETAITHYTNVRKARAARLILNGVPV